MIYCPKCGAANRDASKFCNDCGAQLPSASGLRCPMCGKMNALGNVYCDSCSARLVPMTAQPPPAKEPPAPESTVPIKRGLSLPTKPREAPAETPSKMSDEVPDWLARIQQSEPSEEPSDWAAPEPAAGGSTDWLRDLRKSAIKKPVDDEPSQPKPEAAPPPEEQAPDWLQGVSPLAEPALPTAEEAEIPDWLRGMAPSAESALPSAESATEMPDWMTSLREAAAPASSAETPAPAEIPDWLKDMAPSAAPPAGQAAPAAPERLPDWLKDMAPAAAQAQEAESIPSLPPLATTELPAWLQEMKAALPPKAAAPTSQPAAGGLAQAAIPAWLEALRPKDLTLGAAKTEEELTPEETEGILAGLRDVLPWAEAAAQSQGGGVPLQFQIPASDLSRAGIFNEILTRGLSTMVRRGGETRAQKIWGGAQRRIVFLLVLLAVILPQIPGMHSLIGPLVNEPQLSPAAQKVMIRISELPEGAPVLIAFDYDPTQAGEMDAIARPILKQLLGRRARIIAVSLYPLGPTTAQMLWTDIISETQSQDAQFVNLGYVPGQDMGVRQVTMTKFEQLAPTDFMGQARPPLLQEASSIQDVELIIELAATPDSLRWWVEQLATRPNAPPLLAGVSAAAAPLSRPYLSSMRPGQPSEPQLSGMVNGLPDALVYLPEQANASALESLVLASAVMIGLIGAGIVYQLVSQLRRRR